MFVLIAGIGIAAFSEGVQQVSRYGTEYAFGAYLFLSFSCMLTPLMPGSIVDVTGGFLFTYVLVIEEGFTFPSAWFIGLVSVIFLHYMGACAQWYIGTWSCVQIFANRTFAPGLLAASDAVLGDAHFMTVGLIGYSLARVVKLKT